MSSPTISYAETDDDCVQLHRFLCLVSKPALFAPIDPYDSINEVMRVRDEGVSIVGKVDGEIVGALGIVPMTWWYNNSAKFLGDRWFFIYPQFNHSGLSSSLLAEASAIAKKSGLPLIITGKKKIKDIGNGTHFLRPDVYLEKDNTDVLWERHHQDG